MPTDTQPSTGQIQPRYRTGGSRADSAIVCLLFRRAGAAAGSWTETPLVGGRRAL